MMANIEKKIMKLCVCKAERPKFKEVAPILLSNPQMASVLIVDYETEVYSLPTNVFNFDTQTKREQIRGLTKIAFDIFDQRFLRKMKTSESKGIVVIADEESRRMMYTAIGANVAKEKSIACVFDIKDSVQNILTLNLDVYYLLNIADLSDNDFKHVIRDICGRACQNCAVFLTFDHFDEEDGWRVDILQKVLSKKQVQPPQAIVAFNAFNPFVALIDSTANLGYIHTFRERGFRLDAVASPIDKPASITAGVSRNTDFDETTSSKLAYRLASIFEQMSEFPTVRYYRAFHRQNRLIAEMFLKHFKERQKSTSKNRRVYSRNYTLIIVDRSIDLLTPILHSSTYLPFVFQELELIYNSGDNQIDEKLSKISVDQVYQTVIDLVKQNSSDAQNDQKKRSLQQHIENIEMMNNKLKNGYRALMDVESMVLGKSKTSKASDKNVKEKTIKKLLHATHKAITPLDIIRLFTIYLLTEEKIVPKYEKLLKNKKQLTAAELEKVSEFAKLTKRLFEANKIALQKLIDKPMIAQIINAFSRGKLSNDTFPEAERGRGSDSRNKIFIFMLGGLSYSELQFAGNFDGKLEVNLCSDGVMTSRMFYEHLIRNS
ncbi:hypothetical protein B4U79_17359 [Dinothrombium tinctorium]|uniref:Uncharacterized protein n=1 Tax=Dinothrombium tinctorium TaxID=1965070 RepID=A0A3S3QSX2_9ACAR|nr:hypothetical protein B4U79_17359 [Dinothrombium tinctorium]